MISRKDAKTQRNAKTMPDHFGFIYARAFLRDMGLQFAGLRFPLRFAADFREERFPIWIN
jgi:hypothetical protein